MCNNNNFLYLQQHLSISSNNIIQAINRKKTHQIEPRADLGYINDYAFLSAESISKNHEKNVAGDL